MPAPLLFSLGAAAALALFGSAVWASTKVKGDRAFGEYLSSECVTCHQISGRVVGGVPAIVGIEAESFVALMESYKNKVRENQVMQTIASKFNDEEIAALAVYFESVKPKR
ncbi:MAG: hypothetical protein IOD03_15695 [Methylocystis sp.]|jgi:cytochrome c553|nr:hypothetical protein [Methylocystis sp.]MCA3593437.1 hypothetical protein [Methylocystis sp.]